MSANPVRIFVPIDAAALSVGAEAVAAAIAREAEQRGLSVELIRNGSRGMLWLEPLVEVETIEGRIGYGPVAARDVASLFDAGFAAGGAHALRLGPTEELDWMKRQQRLTFERVGVIDPLSIADYRAHGGFKGLEKALALTGSEIVEAVKASGLRGRGGAGFPTGIKWKTVHDAKAEQKYIVCNADEGDSGTFADRMLFEGDPYLTIEGMTIAAIAVGATRGYIYLRSEYPHAHRTLQRAILKAEAAGLIGASVMGSQHAFHLEVRLGAGAYICGEETSLLESLEGKRAIVRAKPPLPALQGLFGKPTVVNNVLSFAAVPWIMDHGAQAYADYGMGRSRGTLPVQLGGNIRRGGLVELAKAGKVRILATTNERRWFELPDVPTMKESGFPQFTAHSWIGLAGPAGMNPEIVAKLNAAAGKALADPKAQDQLKTLGVLPNFSSPAEFAARIAADRAVYAGIVAKAGLTFQ